MLPFLLLQNDIISYSTIRNIGEQSCRICPLRQLATLQQSANMVQYTYDSSGLRLSKTVNGATTNYYYDDAGQLIRAKNGINDLWFYYGVDGTAQTFALNGSSYYYLKNLQGDVTGIVNHGGEVVARYTYDAWGKLLTVTDGAGNDVSIELQHCDQLVRQQLVCS